MGDHEYIYIRCMNMWWNTQFPHLFTRLLSVAKNFNMTFTT